MCVNEVIAVNIFLLNRQLVCGYLNISIKIKMIHEHFSFHILVRLTRVICEAFFLITVKVVF